MVVIFPKKYPYISTYYIIPYITPNNLKGSSQNLDVSGLHRSLISMVRTFSVLPSKVYCCPKQNACRRPSCTLASINWVMMGILPSIPRRRRGEIFPWKNGSDFSGEKFGKIVGFATGPRCLERVLKIILSQRVVKKMVMNPVVESVKTSPSKKIQVISEGKIVFDGCLFWNRWQFVLIGDERWKKSHAESSGLFQYWKKPKSRGWFFLGCEVVLCLVVPTYTPYSINPPRQFFFFVFFVVFIFLKFFSYLAIPRLRAFLG